MRTKIEAFQGLLSEGIITKTEYEKILTVIDGDTISREEDLYNRYIQQHIAPKLKAPASAVFKEWEPSMVQTLETSFMKEKYTAIISYVDSQNSYGALIRTPFNIKIDAKFNYLGCAIGKVAIYGHTYII